MQFLTILNMFGIPLLLFSVLLEVTAWRLSRIDPHVELFFVNDASTWYTRLPETVPRWELIVVGVVISIFSFLACEYFLQKVRLMSKYKMDWRSVILVTCTHIVGTVTAFLLAAFFAECGKLSVGMLRPDFYYRCLGSQIPANYSGDIITANSQCTQSDVEFILNGRKSFPSEHACAAMSFGWYLTLYFFCNSWMVLLTNPLLSHVLQMLPVASLLGAGWIGVTRMNDHRQHAVSVVAGWLIGIMFATPVFITTSLRVKHCLHTEGNRYNVLSSQSEGITD
eukprot:jgi/Galph1/750/GphlegSOOS_G5464.1